VYKKNYQSSSDFIYAIICWEYGLIGGVIGIRIVLAVALSICNCLTQNNLFGKLVVIGLGFPMIFQAMINMAVAVELLPVLGQTLH
jgi:cell division protein FtsW